MNIILFSSCSQDMPGMPDEIEDFSELEKISFSISSANYGIKSYTKAEASATDEEGKVNNLYVVAIKTKTVTYNDGQKESTTDLSEDKQEVKVFGLGINNLAQGYPTNTFQIELNPGYYKFYVLANLNLYLQRYATIANIKSERELKDLYLTFKETTPLAVEHLPMACFPDEIKRLQDGQPVGITGQEIEVLKTKYIASDGSIRNTVLSNQPVYADLSFLCSKVRYTLIYNNTRGGCSENFGPRYSIRFNVDQTTYTTAAYLRAKTYLFKDHSWEIKETDENGVETTINELNEPSRLFIRASNPYTAYPDGEDGEPVEITNAFWNIPLNRCWFGEGEDFRENYPEGPNDELRLWEFSKEDWENKTDQRIWQGVCYLPENNNEGVAHTLLAFPFVIDVMGVDESGNPKLIKKDFKDNSFKLIWLFGNKNNEDSSGNAGSYHGLERGMMYDVVARVVSIDYIDIKVYVAVKPWEYEGVGNSW